MNNDLELVGTCRWDPVHHALALPARIGENEVTCYLSGEALRDHFGASGSPRGYQSAFFRNREAIDSVARRLFREGRLDSAGYVLLSSDFLARTA